MCNSKKESFKLAEYLMSTVALICNEEGEDLTLKYTINLLNALKNYDEKGEENAIN
jgi:hypothetical protein